MSADDVEVAAHDEVVNRLVRRMEREAARAVISMLRQSPEEAITALYALDLVMRIRAGHSLPPRWKQDGG